MCPYTRNEAEDMVLILLVSVVTETTTIKRTMYRVSHNKSSTSVVEEDDIEYKCCDAAFS